MNKKVKALADMNSEEEKKIKAESMDVYTDIIVYLRGSRITDYNQELIRRDIIQMVLDGEARGQGIKDVIGSDYKEFCDEIIDNFPPKSPREKLLEGFDIGLMCLYILGAISVIVSVAENILQKNSLFDYSLSLADVINYLLFTAIAVTVVNRICRNAFDKAEGQGRKNALVIFFYVCAGFVIFAGVSHFLSGYAVHFHVGFVIAVVLLAYIGHRAIEGRNPEKI